MIELLRTKLFIPRPRKNLVSRQRLVDCLNSGLDGKLTLIAAPAGFGKTTLLSEWIPQSPRCVSWLSLDEGENDPARFWAYFITSLQSLSPQLGDNALVLLQSSTSPAITSILTILINDLAAFRDTFAIVLDDYHVIEANTIHESLTFLIDHLPDNMHLVVTSRVDPPLQVSRLRVRNQLTEIRANDLRFTAEEADAFLVQVMNLKLSANQVQALGARTEGWIAGLLIAGLSIQSHEDPQAFIQAFSGSHRHILAYLAEEVLNRQSDGIQKFLMQTSILERLCGPLCDAVTGGSEGRSILENLEHANLFITPLDNEGVWYRYHRLFVEVLRTCLQQVYAGQLHELHRRAENWYSDQGMINEAMPHAIAREDFDQAARLIESVSGKMLRQGFITSLRRWLNAIPVEKIRTRPRLCLAEGWAVFMGPGINLENAESWADLALQVAEANGLLESDLTGEAAALRAMIAITRGEVTRSRKFAQEALTNLAVDSPWRSAVTFGLATTNLDFGDIAAASQGFKEALRRSQVEGDLFVQLACASFLADIEVVHGHLSRATDMYQQVLAWSNPDFPQKGTVMAHGGLAGIFYERDQLEEALSHIELGFCMVDRAGGEYAAFVLSRVLARLQQARRNSPDAVQILNEAYQKGQNSRVGLIQRQAPALLANLYLAQNDLASAAAWVESSGLSPDDEEVNHPGWKEVEYLTLARVLIALSRHAEAFSVLKKLLKSAELEERNGSIISILLLECLLFEAQGETAHARALFERALILAEPEGYARTFIDEGQAVRYLLLDYRSQLEEKFSHSLESDHLRLLAYSDRLLAAFSSLPLVPTESAGTRIKPLSERELEILQLIAAGRSNQEIAEILVIAISTVKSHINSLYGKLGTNRRTEAVAIAREQGLLTY